VTIPTCRVGRWLALLVVVALALAGCDRGSSPEQELREAVDRTLADDITFEVRVRAEGAADRADADLAASLAALRVAGSHRTDGTYHLALDIGGTDPIVEVRGGEGPLLLRTGLGALLGVTGAPDEAIGDAFGDLDLDDGGQRALLAGFAGDWLALTDADDLADLAAEAAEGGSEPDGSLGRGELLEALEVVDVHEASGGRTFEVLVHLDRLQGASLGRTLTDLLDLPATVPGRVEVRDGRVQQVAFDLAGEGARGTSELLLVVLEHGELPPTEPIDPAATLTLAELAEVVEVLGTSLDDAR
jgi:hypothetical protein